MSQTASVSVSHKLHLALLALFFGSGCAALIYEIVWFQLLQLVIGSSAVSLGMLLGVFMGGLCVGSVAFPRFISSGSHPLRVYALLELGIGCSGDRSLVSGSLCGTILCLERRPGSARVSVPWIDLRGLLIACYHVNGRDTAGARPVSGHHASAECRGSACFTGQTRSEQFLGAC